MAKTSRTIPANQFVAESLEKLAENTTGEQATILLQAAMIYRAHSPESNIRVYDLEDVNQAAARITREATDRN
jgi:hypothetical protein